MAAAVQDRPTCAICLDEGSRAHPLKPLHDGIHEFHEDCISEYAEHQTSSQTGGGSYIACPLCRKHVSIDQLPNAEQLRGRIQQNTDEQRQYNIWGDFRLAVNLAGALGQQEEAEVGQGIRGVAINRFNYGHAEDPQRGRVHNLFVRILPKILQFSRRHPAVVKRLIGLVVLVSFSFFCSIFPYLAVSLLTFTFSFSVLGKYLVEESIINTIALLFWIVLDHLPSGMKRIWHNWTSQIFTSITQTFFEQREIRFAIKLIRLIVIFSIAFFVFYSGLFFALGALMPSLSEATKDLVCYTFCSGIFEGTLLDRIFSSLSDVIPLVVRNN